MAEPFFYVYLFFLRIVIGARLHPSDFGEAGRYFL